MKKVVTTIIAWFISTVWLHAQTDTTTQYFTEDWQSCPPANAFFTSKFLKKIIAGTATIFTPPATPPPLWALF